MATTSDLLLDTLSRVRETVARGARATPPRTASRSPPAPGANTVAWLVWHITRGARRAGRRASSATTPVWEAGGWRERLALPLPADAHGYGMTFDEVLHGAGLGRAPARLLRRRLRGRRGALRGVTDADLDRVVDEHWDPPVTLAVRLVSVLDDCTQHAGQAAYASGILTRWTGATGTAGARPGPCTPG